MPSDLVSAAQILAGSGAATWLVDKLLGPSADALGDQIKVFGTQRLGKIFGRAAEIADRDSMHALPPGFALIAIQKASFSEDVESITEMWARLILKASTSFEVRDLQFADILSQLNGSDAAILDKIYDVNGRFFMTDGNPIDLKRTLSESLKAGVEWNDHSSESSSSLAISAIRDFDFGWPVILRRIENCYLVDQKSGRTRKVSESFKIGPPDCYDVLRRQALIERFEVDFNPGWGSPSIDGYYMTNLGVQFMNACRESKNFGIVSE